MSDTQLIVDEHKAPQFHLLRDAYVELHGIMVEWYQSQEENDRRDEYGHLRRDLTFVEQPMKMVLEIGAQELELLDSFAEDITEVYKGSIIGRVKYGSQIRSGDRVVFALDHFRPGSTDRKVLEVMQVKVQGSRFPIAKLVKLVPVRDRTIA